MRLVLAAFLLVFPSLAQAADMPEDIKATCTLLAAKTIPKLDGIRLKSSEVTPERRNDMYSFYGVRLETDVLGNVAKIYHRCRVSRGGTFTIVE